MKKIKSDCQNFFFSDFKFDMEKVMIYDIQKVNLEMMGYFYFFIYTPS